MKKQTVSAAVAAVMALSLAACGGSASNAASSEAASSEAVSSEAVSSEAASSAAETGFDTDEEITVVSREDGSGTRGAFVELTGVEEKNADGQKVDNTTVTATIANSTNNVMQTVQADETAIGYISMGSLNETVKAVKVEGVEATPDNVKNGSYTLARPFNIVTKGEPSNELTVDFISYIMGADGQAVISDHGYIGNDAAEAFTSAQPAGKLVVAGSSSVSPVMEKLIEAYAAVNPNAEIELQTSDSTTGVNSAVEGSCDIGMASRDLKDSETEAGAVSTAICMDGIAVVVNNANPIEDLTKDQIKSIYVGETTVWNEVE